MMNVITAQEHNENLCLFEQEFELFKATNDKEVVDEWTLEFYWLKSKTWNKSFKDNLKRLKAKIEKIKAIKSGMTQDKEFDNILCFKTKTSDFRLNKDAIRYLDTKRLNMLYKVVCLGY